MTMVDDAIAQPPAVGRFSRRSFRAKFILVVGAAVLFDLMLGGGIAIWNVQRLSHNATQQVGEGLTEASEEYLRTYINTTAERADLLLDQVHSEVESLANSMQGLIDNPDLRQDLGTTIEANPQLRDDLVYDATGNWAQNTGGASVISVWSYLLGPDKKPLPEVDALVKQSAAFNLFAPALLATGAPKLQMYYVGPKDRPIMRTTPYSQQAQTFDKLYPGHNNMNFWDFFFPGVYEGWQNWIKDPSSRKVPSLITTTAPYIDAITGKLIVSFFHPLWTKDRSDVAGMTAADITLDQLASVVQSVNIAKTGFGFLAMSNGNVIATSKAGEEILGLTSSDVGGQGVTGINRSLRNSSQSAIASLQLPQDQSTTIKHIFLNRGGEDVPYLVVLKQLRPANLWDGKNIVEETMSLGFVVSEREIYQALIAAQDNISKATSRIVDYQLLAVLVSLIIVLMAVFAISGRITAGLSALTDAARRLQKKDYSVRVSVSTRDEIAEVGHAFNRMAEEISFHTENLERLVDERTRELEDANEEITTLNERLKSENVRLGAELDIARHIQMMVLPKANELNDIQQIEIAGYMAPADEVGGDYYDVLHESGRVKVGIGDVTGHGLESGVLMLMVQSVARALQEKGSDDPKMFLEVLNRAIYKNIERTNSDKHLTLAFLDYHDRNVTLSGQHEDVLVIRRDGAMERIDTGDLGFPVGLESDISAFVATRNLPFESGDIIILHTDGVTEAESPSGELFGFDRLCASAHDYRSGGADEIVRGIIADLMAHIGTQKIHDDITLVVMRHR
ncbi:sigma-B regulation protein RsbU (phosphoserine phosphatase) [Rhizobium sp. BK313]|uniref:SpoIIE family protein phosphatase n=1 Tax=Rhizobium sp. BK313 TaxID=2587081 RepID=UPI0010CFD3A8|nr:SpoIIE family protein phosphatase [Rhizobium sp. BK313]MBB3457490.1 sigma-B regulation protein RsbU (phosphoserine phosphatase) [Rhizobium sp. BK313]